MKQIQLKDRVKDLITGQTGVVYGIATYLYEQDQFLVLFDGEKKTEWISSGQTQFVADFTVE